jgi:hypothetical protein
MRSITVRPSRGSSRRSFARRAPRRVLHRFAPLTSTVVALVVVGSISPALAGGGTVGNPQPELARFSVSATSDGGGGGIVLPDGTIVFAWPATGTSMQVCTLHPGSRSCVTRATLAGDGNSPLYGPPIVLATGGADVSVIVTDQTDNITYNSTNDGHTFSAPRHVGTLYSTSTGVDTGGQVVVAGIDPHQGFVIQDINPNGSQNTNEAVLTAGGGCNYNPSISAYNGGVLVACDDLTNTYIWYAPHGDNFSSTGSYTQVGVFHGDQAVDLSGNALLTVPSNSLTSGGVIAFFTGTHFATGHRVPDSKAGDDGYWSMQEVGPTAHVFFEGRRDGYDLIHEATADGVHWSGQTLYGSAINSSDPIPVLGPTSAGQVFESDGNPQLSQPILNGQGVHISIAPPRVKDGVHAVVHGTAAPRLTNQAVTLERLIRGRWYPVTGTHESAAGTFTFTIPGATDTYRAVVNYKPGYWQYGYSNPATLTAVR